MTEWGEVIPVNGKRPDWLGDEEYEVTGKSSEWVEGPIKAAWPLARFIRLPATHPYYLVQRYNAEHGTSFVYWPGGDAAPEDWAGERNSAIDADGRVVWPDADSPNWGRIDKDTPYRGRLNIVGYLRRAKPETATYHPATHVAIKRMTEAEAVNEVCRLWPNLNKESGNPVLDDSVELLRHFGIILPTPTEAERIAAKTGIDLATVTAVLDAREGSDDDD